MKFQGVYTALVTPFRNGQIDTDALNRLVDEQVAAGVAGIVPVGTTGESPTLTYEEHEQVIRMVVARAQGKCQIIAGTGANCTREAIEMTRRAKEDLNSMVSTKPSLEPLVTCSVSGSAMLLVGYVRTSISSAWSKPSTNSTIGPLNTCFMIVSTSDTSSTWA